MICLTERYVYSVKQVAGFLGISTKTMYQIVKDGQIEALWVCPPPAARKAASAAASRRPPRPERRRWR